MRGVGVGGGGDRVEHQSVQEGLGVAPRVGRGGGGVAEQRHDVRGRGASGVLVLLPDAEGLAEVLLVEPVHVARVIPGPVEPFDHDGALGPEVHELAAQGELLLHATEGPVFLGQHP